MSVNKKFAFAAKAAAVVAVVAGVATAGFDIKESKATLAAPSGKCGMLLTLKPSGFDVKNAGSSSAQVVSTIAMVDFDSGTANYVDTKVTNWGLPNAANTSVSGQLTFSVVAGSFAGKYVMTLNNGYNTKFNILSTNSANTYLMQGLPDANNDGPVLSGMCQAL